MHGHKAAALWALPWWCELRVQSWEVLGNEPEFLQWGSVTSAHSSLVVSLVSIPVLLSLFCQQGLLDCPAPLSGAF